MGEGKIMWYMGVSDPTCQGVSVEVRGSLLELVLSFCRMGPKD